MKKIPRPVATVKIFEKAFEVKTTKTGQPAKVFKEVLLNQLLDSITDEQCNITQQLKGHEIKPAKTSRLNFLSKLFHTPRGISSRKGIARDLQNLVAKKISELTGLECGKDKDIQGREMGQSGTDVRLSEAARSLFPFSVEGKSGTINVKAAVKQAKANMAGYDDWLVVYNDPHPWSERRQEAVVIIRLDLFFDLMKSMKRLENGKIRAIDQINKLGAHQILSVDNDVIPESTDGRNWVEVHYLVKV